MASNEFETALSYFRPDPEQVKDLQARQDALNREFEKGQSEARRQLQEQQRVDAARQKELERQQKEQAKLAAEKAARAQRDQRAAQELQFRRSGRPFFTDANGNLLPVDDDVTWARKQAEAQEAARQKEQTRADTAFRKSEAVRLNQEEGKVQNRLDTFKSSAHLAGQASNAKAAELSQKTARLKALDKEMETAPPERITAIEAERNALSTELETARQEKQTLDDNERTLRLAQTNEELLQAPHLRDLSAQRTALPLRQAPSLGPVSGQTTGRPASQLSPAATVPVNPVAGASPTGAEDPSQVRTPAAQDPNKALAVLQGKIATLRERGDYARADALEKRYLNPAGWQAEQQQFRQTATPEQLTQRIQEESAVLAQTETELTQAATQLTASRQQILTRLDAIRTRNEALLQGPRADADIVILTDVNTGAQTRWHKAAAEAYLTTAQSLEDWEKQHQGELDAISVTSAELKKDADEVNRNIAALQFKGREAQREAQAQEAARLNAMREAGYGDIADALQAENEASERRLADVRARYQDPAVRRVAEAAVQSDRERSLRTIQDRQTAQDEAVAKLYKDWASHVRTPDWRSEQDVAVTLQQKAKEAGLSEQDLRQGLETAAALDWSKPRAVDANGSPVFEDARRLPNGSLTVNPDHWLDPEAYAAAVNATEASPEAKQAALEVRAELAAPLAADLLQTLRKNAAVGKWIEKNTAPGDTPLQKLEKIQADLKAGGWLAASLQRFQSGGANIGKSAGGLISAYTSGVINQPAEYFDDRAQAFEALAAMADKGTGKLGQFASKVIGASPSVLASLTPARLIGVGGSLAGLGANALNRLALATSALASGAQSAGGTFVDAFKRYREQGLSANDASARALTPALLSGAVTTALTGLSGLRGAESFLKEGGKELIRQSIRQRLANVGIGFADEALEEGIDQALQGFIARASYAPEKSLKEILSESLEAGLIGGVLGSSITGVKETSEALTDRREEATAPPHRLRETVAAAQEAIRTNPRLNAIQRQRASGVLKIAQGRLDLVTSQEANAMGWTKQDGKWKRAKDYTGPAVLDFYNGDPSRPVILQGYIDALDTQLPEVHAAIGLDEADLLEVYSRPPASPSTTANSGAAAAQPPQTTANTNLEPPAQGTATAAPAPTPAIGAEPLRSQPSPTTANASREAWTPSTTANSPEATTRQIQIARHLQLAGMPAEAAQQVAAQAIQEQGLIGPTYADQVTSPEFNSLLDRLGVTGDRRTLPGTAPLTLPGSTTAQPPQTTENSPQGATTANLKQRIAAKEITDHDVAVEMARQFPQADGAELINRMIQDLGFIPQRAKLAIVAARPAIRAMRSGQPAPTTGGTTYDPGSLETDAIPASGRAAPVLQPSPTTANAAQQPSTTATSPSANSLIQALPPEQRKRARTSLKALDKALAKWGKAFDRIRFVTGPNTSHLQAVDDNGSVTLEINLPAFLDAFNDLARSEAAVTATVTEELVHAVVMHLGRSDARFSKPRLIALWNELDATGQTLVWQTYNNLAIEEGNLSREVPTDLSDDQKYHMAHEMLRLLVQQKAFREQFTEAVGHRRNITRWIRDLLRTLSRRLTRWMNQADPSLRAGLEGYRAQLIAALARFEGEHVANLIEDADLNGRDALRRVPLSSEASTDLASSFPSRQPGFVGPPTPAEASAIAMLEAHAEQALQDESLALGRAEAERLMPGVSNTLQRRALARQLSRQSYEAQVQALLDRMAGTQQPQTTANGAQRPSATANAPQALPGPAQVSALNILALLDEQARLEAEQEAARARAERTLPGVSDETQRRALRRRLNARMWEAMFLDLNGRVERRMATKAQRITPARLREVEDVLRVARGEFILGTAYDRRNVSTAPDGRPPVRPFGYANEALLKRLGIEIADNGTLYTTSDNGPAYVERNHILFRQAYLDQLALDLPITRQQIPFSEAEARAHFNLPAKATPTTGRNLETETVSETDIRAQADARLAKLEAAESAPAPRSNGLPDPSNYDSRTSTGADLISFMQREGFNLGWPNDTAGGEWDWLRSLESQAAQLKEHAATLKAAASRGDVSHPQALLLWLENQGIIGRDVEASRIDEVEEAAAAAGFDLGAGIGNAILDAVSSRVAARDQSRTSSDPATAQEAQTLRFERDTAEGPIEIQPGDLVPLWEEGSAYVFVKTPDGESHRVAVTDAQWQPMDPDSSEMDDYQDNSPWFRGKADGQPERLVVTLQNGTTYGRQTVPAESRLRIDHPGNTGLSQTTANDGAAVPQPQPTTANASLEDDYQSSVTFGRELEDSIPPDIDLAATADDYLDSLDNPEAPPAQRIFASPRNSGLTRNVHRLALPLSNDNLDADARLRSPAHILQSLQESANSGADGRADPRQRGEPGPSVGGSPREAALLVDWARDHGRHFPIEAFRVARVPNPSQVKAGGEHYVVPGPNGRLYKFTKPGQYGAQALDGPAYLERWALANRLLNDDVRFEGITQFPGEDDYRAVVSQPFQVAEDPDQPDASIPEIRDWLESKGYYDFEGYLVHPILGVQIWDIQTPGNVIKTPDGLVAVDLQLEPAPSDRLRRLREEVKQGPRTAIFAAPRSTTTANNSQPPPTTASRIQAAARRTDTAPTEAQKEAENYRTGKVTVQGLKLSIENPRGSVRSGTDASGKPWSVTMPHHYGRILGTKGADKDHVDFFLGPNPDSGVAFIVNQRKPGNHHFDEHKVMLGFDKSGPAIKGYLAAYAKGWRGYSNAVQVTIPQLKTWLESGDMSKPATREAIERSADTPSSQPLQTTANASGSEQPTTANSPATPIPAAPRSLFQTASDASFNHIDRALHRANQRLAEKLTSTDTAQSLIEAYSAWYGADRIDANFVRSMKELVQGQLAPETALPREVLSAIRMMNIRKAMGEQQALDVSRALSAKPKFSDLAYPEEFVENPMWREKLFEAMEGRADMASLPPAIQKVGQQLRRLLIQAGREAVKQGRMSPDTFEGLRTTYMPRFTKDDAEASAGDWGKAFKLGVKDILAQRSTAFHIVDRSRKGPDGKPALVQHDGRKWRFRDKQARDAYYEELIDRESLNEANLADLRWLTPSDRRALRAITPEMLKAPALMSDHQSDLLGRVQREMRSRFTREDPFEPPELVKDPVYAVMRYLAQMSSDNATAEFFNLVAANPEWVTTTETKGFKAIPDAPRWGRLAGKYVRKDIADQILELAESPNQALALYDSILRLWKTGKTVLNPATHMRNLIGNIPFAQFAGNNPLNPANWPHYKKAFDVLRSGGREYNQLYETGVLGADYASQELRSALTSIIPVTEEKDKSGDVMKSVLAIGNRAAQWAKLHTLPSATLGAGTGALLGALAAGPIGAIVGAGIGAYAHPLYRAMLFAYRFEDDIFKAAAFMKARDMGMSPEAAAQHVRDWFPYYDSPTSGTFKVLGRSTLPFVSFARESARIGLKAAKERPLSLMASLAIPSTITAISAAMLGLSERDKEEIKKDMRGKGAKLLGMTPLAGVPIFSMVLPWRTKDGQLQQFDLSSTHPFADWLANRVENFNNQGTLQTWARSIFSNPVFGLGYTVATGKDAFGDREVLPADLSPWDYTQALSDHIWKTAVPPIAPGGSNWQMIESSNRRQANKTLALRNPAQSVSRAVLGLDVRSADPNIYRQADDFRKAQGLPVSETNQAFPTDAAGRARKALFEELVQPSPDSAAITRHLQTLNDLGKPVRSVKDILELLDARRPDAIINPKRLRGPFRASLPPESQRVLNTALQEFQKARANAPAALQEARKKLYLTTRSAPSPNNETGVE